MSTSATSTRDIKTIIDEGQMTGGRWAVVALCFLIALLDGFDTQSIAFIGPAIAQDFAMGPADMTWVASTAGSALRQ